MPRHQVRIVHHPDFKITLRNESIRFEMFRLNQLEIKTNDSPSFSSVNMFPLMTDTDLEEN